LNNADQIVDWLAERLTSNARSSALASASKDVAAIWDLIQLHGISLALAESPARLEGLPDALQEKIQHEARMQSLWEHSHRQLIAQVITALAEAGIASLVFKGTGLAYSVYENPAIRRRGDTDLLIRRSQLNEARQVLEGIGMVSSVVRHSGQETWIFASGIGFSHAVDLHWEVLGQTYLDNLMDVEECFARSIPLPRLAEGARTLDPVLSFLRCAINQAFHGVYGYRLGSDKRLEDDRLIWRMDAHLLANSLDRREWQELAEKALDMRLASYCVRYLERARETFGTQVPEEVLQQLREGPQEGRLQRYLASDSFERARLDLFAAGDWRTRGEILLQHVWPPEHHLHERFPTKTSWPLPLLQIYRLVSAPVRVLQSR